jgi:hypothetical protein
VGTGDFYPQGKIDNGVQLTTQLHLDPRLEVSGAIHPGPIHRRRHRWNICRPNFFCLSWAKSNRYTGLDRPLGFQEFGVPRILRQSAHEGNKVSVVRSGHLYSQKTTFILNSVRGWVNRRTIVRPEELSLWKIPVIPSEIEPPTFRLVT